MFLKFSLFLKKLEIKTFKKRDWVFNAFGIYITLLLIFAVVGDRGLWASYRVWKRYRNIEQQNEKLKSEIEELQKQVLLFKSDARTIEKYAREEFNMHGSDEVQVVFE